MLRVGLTGGLGSGKSTVARMLGEMGARVIEADALGRAMMQPGEAVYRAIVERFGMGVVVGGAAGAELGLELDRGVLARIAFEDGRVEELNAIVHPAVIAREAEMAEAIGRESPGAVVVVESALLFETKFGGERGWRRRLDRVVLVRASEERKVARYVARVAGSVGVGEERRSELEAEARRRLAAQMGDEAKSEMVDFGLMNDGTVRELEWQVDRLWGRLVAEAGERRGTVQA